MLLIIFSSAFLGEPLRFFPAPTLKRKRSNESTHRCEILEEDTAGLMRCTLDAVISLNSPDLVPREPG